VVAGGKILIVEGRKKDLGRMACKRLFYVRLERASAFNYPKSVMKYRVYNLFRYNI
jgi:hypothetical protein